MKKLILKTAVFVLPFLLLFVISELFYTKEKGDLLRLGYIYNSNNFNSKVLFKKYYDRKKKYQQVSEINLDSTHTFDFISIGDSFSNQGSKGYQNCLVNNSTVNVLDIDRDLYDNPIKVIYDLINGGFFEKNKTKYIILQNVERIIVSRGQAIVKTDKLTLDSIQKSVIEKKLAKSNKDKKDKTQFFSKDVIRFFMYNINYMYDDNALVSPVYNVKTTQKMFSVAQQNLLFFEDDLKVLKENNDKQLVENLQNELNFLSAKLAKLNIKLIVLTSPDKYDLYYDYIVDKEKYTKPLFFDYFNKLDKNYIYIDAKKILSDGLKSKKDIYLYDDTHWSPNASELLAKEILKVCK